MARVNLELLRKKRAELQAAATKVRHDWKPSYEKEVIRLIPYKYNLENPFIELKFYYNFGKVPIVSPTSFGNADPIYELSEELKSTGDRDEWNLGVSLQPKLRTFVPIIVRGKEEEGAKFWGFGRRVYNQLLEYFDNEDYGDITDPDTGTDLEVRYEKAPGQDWPNTVIVPKRNRTPLVTDAELLRKIFNEMPEVTDVFEEKSYEELEAILKKYLDSDTPMDQASEPEDDDSETPPPIKKLSSSNKDSSDKKTSYSDQFESLFGNK